MNETERLEVYYRKDTSEAVKLWVTRIFVWKNLRNCLNYYKDDFYEEDYIEAIHIYRESEQEKRNQNRLEQFNLKWRLYNVV